MNGTSNKLQAAAPVYRLQYNTTEAAKLMCVSKRTFNKWILSGELPSYKINGIGINFVKHEDLREFQERVLVLNSFLSATRLS